MIVNSPLNYVGGVILQRKTIRVLLSLEVLNSVAGPLLSCKTRKLLKPQLKYKRFFNVPLALIDKTLIKLGYILSTGYSGKTTNPVLCILILQQK